MLKIDSTRTRLAVIAICGLFVAASTQLDWIKQVKNKPFIDVREFAWLPQSPGGSISVGSNTETLSPCPIGLPVIPYSFSTGNYWVYISGGTGTAEAVMVTGGTCISGGSSGTIIFTARYTHSGHFSVGPASQGVQEAVWVASTFPTREIRVPSGSIALHAPIFFPRVAAGGWAVHFVGEGETSAVFIPDLDTASPNTSIWVANTCGNGSQSCMGLQTKYENSSTAINVTGAVDNGSGLIRLTLASNPYQDQDFAEVAGVGGVPNATGVWRVTNYGNTIDLQGSTFAGLFTTGGTATKKIKAVFLVESDDKAPLFENFSIGFNQPLVPSTIADIIQYPTAIYARGTFGLDTNHVMIFKSWVGIDLCGIWDGISAWAPPSGRHRIENLDVSAYRYAINIDGALDSTRFINMHSWPFYAMTAGQQAVFYTDPSRRAIWAGRIDDVHITNGLFIGGGLDFHCGKASGSTFGSLSGNDFDGVTVFPGLNASCATLVQSNDTFTTGSGCSANSPLLAFSSGTYTGVGLQFLDYGCGLNNLVQLLGGVVSFTGNSLVRVDPVTSTSLPADILATNYRVIVANNSFTRSPSIAWSNPVIDVQGSTIRASILGNQGSGLTTGSGVFVKIATDNWHRVLDNVMPGYTYSFPTPGAGGIYQNQVLTYAELAAYSPILNIQPMQMFCNDCNATCTAGGGSGVMCFYQSGTWTH